MNSNFIILSVPVNGTGHINASVGLCLSLQKKGHRIVFATEKTRRGAYAKYGFEEEIYEDRETKENEKPLEFLIQEIEKLSHILRSPPEEQVQLLVEGFKQFVSFAKYSNNRIAEIIETVKPDIIIQDNYVASPAIVNSKIPLVILYSCNPLYAIDSESLPPACFGLPLGDDKDWKRCRELRIKSLRNIWKNFNDWIVENGAPTLPENHFQYKNPFLNVLMYPKIMFEDYAKRIPLGNEWMLIEHAVTETKEKFDLPEGFKQKPGKIIYLSLGSMMSIDVELMQRLISFLSKSAHKYIVSTGLQHEKIKLADNMWGESYLPQLKILPLCDLFITHGGNNSLTEALYFGVPMIVMPVAVDQHDNAQRVLEMNIGTKINTYNVNEEELLSTIDILLGDDQLRKRLKVISDQIKTSNEMNAIVERIEEIANKR